MLQKLHKQKGFTVIEVLIVLAIAGLILLIVLRAVPALNRNSRNTQRRNDVAKMMGALQEATNNNNGKPPLGTSTPAVVTDSLAIYDASGVNYDIKASGAASLPGSVDAKTVIIRNNVKCTGASGNSGAASAPTSGIASGTGATSRSVVAIYAVELNGNNVQAQCIDS